MKESFKEFLSEEKENSKHFKAFFEYEHEMHDDFVVKIKNDLKKQWSRVAEKYDDYELEESEETNKYCSICLDANDAKVGRYGTGKNIVQPSVKIGTAFPRDIMHKCKNECMRRGRKILQKYCERMNKNVPGTPFTVQQEDGQLGDIRLVFNSGRFHKTIFLIAIEPGSKLERVYFRDFLGR